MRKGGSTQGGTPARGWRSGEHTANPPPTRARRERGSSAPGRRATKEEEHGRSSAPRDKDQERGGWKKLGIEGGGRYGIGMEKKILFLFL